MRACVFILLLFQVFELNSSSRRSGGQVISILQEATQSHQIMTQRKVIKQAATSSQDEGCCEVDKSNVTQNDKPSSKTITSFFKPIKGVTNEEESKLDVPQNSSYKVTAEDDHFKLTLASHTVILIEEVC